MKRNISLLLAVLLAVSSLTGCGLWNKAPDPSGSTSSSAPDPNGSGVSQPVPEPPTVKLTVLNGPTGVGAAQLIDLYGGESLPQGAPIRLDWTVAASNEEVTAALINGDADIAAIATNVAANLCGKTDGAIQVLAVNTLGVLYILEKGETVRSMADLKGKTLYAPSTARGANPEYVLNHLLAANGVQPEEVDVEWMTPQEISAKLTSQESGLCMLPVPAATALLVQDSGVREALSLSDEWDKLGQGKLAMGCLAARTGYIQEHPREVEQFLSLYGESIAYMSDPAHLDEAAALTAKYAITPNEKIAARAIPQCNLVFLTGEEMQETLQAYYGVLFRADPDSIGGAIPYDSFYYGVS